jgi:hypothetical protein
MEALTKMFASGDLSFSFEILVGETSMVDGIEVIDASEKNHLIAMAVVSQPADISAKALALVAEVDKEKGKERAFSKTTYVQISEVSIQTMARWVWEAMCIWFYDDVYSFYIERVCPDCAILYNEMTAQTFKMEYIVQDNGLIITDLYEVTFTRKDGVDELDKIKEAVAQETAVEETDVTQEEVADTAEVQPEEVEQEAAETAAGNEEGAAETPEPEQETEQPEAHETASTQEEVEIDTLRERISVLEEQLARQETLIASYKHAENVKKARIVAEKGGLDLDDAVVQKAIDSADLTAIATLIASLAEQEDAESDDALKANPFVAEISAKGQERDHSYMFEPIKE